MEQGKAEQFVLAKAKPVIICVSWIPTRATSPYFPWIGVLESVFICVYLWLNRS
jgi:hypothetical protein